MPAFIQILLKRLREPKLEALVRNLFRPSYGGNRNFTLMYSLGCFLVSSDDDMRPTALIKHSPESLGTDEICRGKLMKSKSGGFEETSFDLLTAFRDALGKAVRHLPSNYEKGNLVTDTSMDLETNTTKTFSRENLLILDHGSSIPVLCRVTRHASTAATKSIYINRTTMVANVESLASSNCSTV